MKRRVNEISKPPSSGKSLFETLSQIVNVVVPQNHLLVLSQHDQFHSFLEPGSHFWLTKWFYLTQEHLISTGMKPAKREDIICRSLDGIPCLVDAEVVYTFSPKRIADADLQAALAMGEPIVPDLIAKRYLGVAVSIVAGQFDEADLRNGRTLPVLRAAIKDAFVKEVDMLGIHCIDIVIEKIVAHERLEEQAAKAAAYRNLAHQLEDMSSASAEQIYEIERLASFSKGGGQSRMNYSSGSKEQREGPKRDPTYRPSNRPNSQDSYQ